MKDKASWVLIIVAVIGALSANLQTILSTAGDRADRANTNIKLVVESLQSQMKYSDIQLATIAEKATQLNEELARQETDIHELREMLFTLTTQRNNRAVTKVEKQILTDAVTAKESLSKSVSHDIVKIIKRPDWPPTLLN
jgi:ribosomal protein L31E